jgi:hypothetical protein
MQKSGETLCLDHLDANIQVQQKHSFYQKKGKPYPYLNEMAELLPIVRKKGKLYQDAESDRNYLVRSVL